MGDLRSGRSTRPAHPILIVNPRSGDGRSTAVNLIPAAQRLGLEIVIMEQGADLAGLASSCVDRGCDHLLMAGGDGSLAAVAGIALAREVAFSCVPVGTRNHFAMDLGLDRSRPLRSLEAVSDGEERLIDVGRIGGQVFLNNVSFGLYAQAIADPGYRSHRARSMADAAVQMAIRLDSTLKVSLPDGGELDEIEVLLASNNPYRFIGPPDFANRPTLDSGVLGIVWADRRSRLRRGPAAFTRRESSRLTVIPSDAEVQVGVDGELRIFPGAVEVAIEPRALRVIVPRGAQSRTPKESIEQLSERAVKYLGGRPQLPTPDEMTAKSPLLGRLHEIDVAVFQRVAGWHSPSLDRLMPALSEAASHSKIWMAMALLIAAIGGKKGRRTAVEGLTAVAVTSLLANVVAKGLFRRERPTDPVPKARRLDLPRSSSMPSGHTASGAAFARIIGASYPAVRVPLHGLAAAIGFSRVYTGVHYPGDVLAGWLLGRGVAAVVRAVAAAGRHIHRLASRIARSSS